MNKNEHLGEYRLYDGIRFQGKATGKTNGIRCFRCNKMVSNGNVCQYCEPYKYDSCNRDKSERKGKECV